MAVENKGISRAEEALRLLATATTAARLYPPSSALPLEAARRFAARVAELTVSGPLRIVIDPDGFRSGDGEVTGSQIAGLAEGLHAMQAGQLVIAPGITVDEVAAFIGVMNSDPAEVRAVGGPRAALVAAGVTHIAVIEVSLRASDESGLLGIDLTTAPLDELATAVVDAVEQRATAAAYGPAADTVALAVERLEEATRELARERIATALQRLDEETRLRVLSLALSADTEGCRMDGMLSVISTMKPAALARLLRLVAARAGTDPRRVASALELPPETLRALSLMLQPLPSYEPDFGLSPEDQAREMALIVGLEEDTRDLDRQLAIASPALSAGRALATATAVSRSRLDAETVRAMAEVLPQAARDGAFMMVREALRRLDEIAAEPSLTDDVVAARSALADPELLGDVCRAPVTDADAAIAGEILAAAGPIGAEVLLSTYVRLPESKRSLLRPVLRGMSEGVLGAARPQLRGTDTGLVVAVLRVLPQLGDRRAVPVIAEAVNHLEEPVRFAAVSALAAIPGPEATAALTRALNNREPETQRHVVREIGRARINDAVPALSRALEDINVLQRTYETRKEIISALERIGTPEAERALRGFAQRTLGVGRKTRELRSRAIQVADELARERGVSQP